MLFNARIHTGVEHVRIHCLEVIFFENELLIFAP